MPKYSKEHYKDVAEILNKEFRQLDAQYDLHTVVGYFEEHFIKLFQQDNPHFIESEQGKFRNAIRGK